jgi:hypothetical protein
MKAHDIVAWTYDADIHCPHCARLAGMTKEGVEDSQGNEPHPVFACDEGWSDDVCGDCGEPIDD